MSSRSLIQYIAGMAFAFVILTACGGGGGSDINFNFEGNNWPWPWPSNADFFANKTFSQNVTVNGQINLDLDGVNGEVVINGQPGGDTVTVTAEARVGSDSFEDAQAGLDQLEISVTDNNSTIFVQTVQPVFTQGRQYVVDYTITVPSDLTVRVTIVNGHVTVNDMDNSVFVVVENGNVDFADIFSDVTVSVENGGVNGTVTLPANGEAIVSTVNGDIDLDIPKSTSAELFALVTNGNISWDNLDLMDVQQTNQSLKGTLGDGAGLIDLKTINGYIDIVGFSL
jgi:DUF4097 and DUF4098 domain-containing protein YvlB